jgi:hypothetical protein
VRSDPAQRLNRIVKELQDVTADRGVEESPLRELVDVALHELDVFKAQLRRALTRSRDRSWIALDAENGSGRTNDSGCKHRYVADARADIQDTHSVPDAGLSEEALRTGFQTSGLPNKPLVLLVAVSEVIAVALLVARHANIQ